MKREKVERRNEVTPRKYIVAVMLGLLTAYSVLWCMGMNKVHAATGDVTVLYLDKGDITIGADTVSGYDEKGDKITTPNSNGYEITQTLENGEPTVTGNKIEITGGTHKVTIKNINAKQNEVYATPFYIKQDAVVELTVIGNNYVEGGAAGAGIGVMENAHLIITKESEGTLEAKDEGGTGIGGVDREEKNCGSITINGGSIVATVSEYYANAGAGIGGSYNKASGKITITGGTIVTTSTAGAGIGGGSNSDKADNKEIIITGGVITATSITGAGIGGGSQGDGGKITITGGTVKADSRSRGAGIGGGSEGDGGTVIITGGSVLAQSTSGETIGKGKGGTNSGTLRNKAGQDVYLCKETFKKSEGTQITIKDFPQEIQAGLQSYGFKDIYTLGNGSADSSDVYLYLPETRKKPTITPTTDAGKLTRVYAGATFDITDLFAFEANASTASYSIASGVNTDTGVGTLTSEGILTVTKAGTFTIQVDTKQEGNYLANSATVLLTISKANGTGTVAMTGYTYGATKSAPTVSNNTGKATFYYHTENRNQGGTPWSEVPNATTLDVGNYYMYAQIAATDLYEAAVTEAVPFTIAKGTLDSIDLSGIVTVPYKGGKPQAEITAEQTQSQYTGKIEWTNQPEHFLGSNIYLATISLEEGKNYTLTGLASGSVTHTKATSCAYDAAARKITIEFPETDERLATTFTTSGTLQKTTYTIGEVFDPTGLTLTVNYDDGSSENITDGYTVSPTKMEANTSVVVLTYRGMSAEAIPVVVSEKLISIENPESIGDIRNGQKKTAEALGLPDRVVIRTTTQATAAVSVVWDVENAAYNPDVLQVQAFEVHGTVILPEEISNQDACSLDVTISVTVNAAVLVEQGDAQEGEDAAKIEGITEGQEVPPGSTLDIQAWEFTRGETTYVPIGWRTNPSGSFVKNKDGIYVAQVDTSVMSLGNHSFIVTYREYDKNLNATGNLVERKISYTIKKQAASDVSGTDNTAPTKKPLAVGEVKRSVKTGDEETWGRLLTLVGIFLMSGALVCWNIGRKRKNRHYK